MQLEGHKSVICYCLGADELVDHRAEELVDHRDTVRSSTPFAVVDELSAVR